MQTNEADAVIWLAPKEAAKVTGYSEQSIHRWIKQGRMRAIRFGPRATKVPVPRALVESAKANAEPERAAA
jgi:excisionase family DNA binding protein